METADRKRGEIVGKTELAKAYVQIIPSAKGIGGMLQNEVGGETDAAGKSLGGRIGGAIKVAVIAAGIGKAISASISEGAELEQSIGGIETLFKDSAEKVKRCERLQDGWDERKRIHAVNNKLLRESVTKFRK